MFLEVQNVTKDYGVERVLKGVSLTADKGERIAIIGPSGSGKSTLLNTIGALDDVTSGSIRLNGMEITSLSPKEKTEYRRKHLGYVFQFYNLIANLTVQENIEVCAYLTSNPLGLEELLNTLGLYEHRHKYPSELSGGQQQRCSIARALIKNPTLLLCDEPTGALDSVSSIEMLSLLEAINVRYHTTMILVTHNESIQQMCHRLIAIKDGRIINDKKNEQLIPAREILL